MTQPAPRSVVLLVSGDRSVAEKLRLVLRADCDVWTARDDGEALELAADLRPSLIVIEGLGASVTRLSMCRVFRNAYDTRRTPILFLSEDGSLEVRVAAVRAGADKFVARPIRWGSVCARVKALVKTQHGRHGESSLRRVSQRMD